MSEIVDFQQTVWEYYRAHGRHDLPWRQPEADGSFSAYKILVSELMLQQTQVARVIPKFTQFVHQFPTIQALAAAPLSAVLKSWSGLGYNRRAKFLWQAAGTVAAEHQGMLPQTSSELVTLPGIGPNTAGALLAYAYNTPTVFIETNIRTVFIHHFFMGSEQVSDKLIADRVAQTLPDQGPGRAARARIHSEPGAMTGTPLSVRALRGEVRNPGGVSHYRQWYWALMDYGTHLKQTVGNLNTLSKHYIKQSTFAGSRRQIRGQVLRALAAAERTLPEIQQAITDERLPAVLEDLTQEGFIIRATSGHYKLAD